MVSYLSETSSTPDELDSLINVETTTAFEKDLQKLNSKELIGVRASWSLFPLIKRI